MAKMNWIEKPIVNSKSWNWIYRRLIYNKFLDFVGSKLKGNILEIGCGVGKTTHFLAEKYDKIKITAVDYDKEQIKVANKNKKYKNIKFELGDATSLNFKKNSFDCVIETNVFHHIKDYQKAIREVRRVLKNNGVFYLIDVSKYFLGPIATFFLESAFTRQDFINNLENNGFKIEKYGRNFFFFIAAKKV